MDVPLLVSQVGLLIGELRQLIGDNLGFCSHNLASLSIQFNSSLFVKRLLRYNRCKAALQLYLNIANVFDNALKHGDIHPVAILKVGQIW